MEVAIIYIKNQSLRRKNKYMRNIIFIILIIFIIGCSNLNQSNNRIFQLIELIIAKQRNGPLGTIKLKFNEKQTKFSELETV